MENMEDLEKLGSTHTFMEDFENRRNMSMKSIGAMKEINQ